jgi:HK97 family phage major capsid protein/HK97 family phage prohead protease
VKPARLTFTPAEMKRTAAHAPQMHQRAFSANAGPINAEARTVDLAFSSEAPVARWFGNEILSHAPGSVRLDRLNNGGALLLDHDPTKQIGVVVSARIDADGKGRATVRFSKGPLAEEIFQDVKDGIRRLVSVGYQIHNQDAQGSKGGVESVRVTDWEPYEISLVSIPADDSVGVGRSISTHIQRPSNNHHSVNRQEITAALRTAGVEYSNNLTDEQLRALLPTQQTRERTRVSSINAIADQMRSSGVQVDAARAIAEGITFDEFRERAFSAMIAQRNTPYQPGLPGPYSRDEQRDLRNYSITRAIHMAGQGRLDGLEAEISQELARSMGKAPDGFYVPHSALMGQRSGLSVTNDSGAYGGNNVGVQIGGFIDALRPMLAVAQLGATVMSGLSSNVSLPRQSAASTASWKPETGELDEKTPAIDQVELTPKRIGAWTKFSKQLVVQSTPDVESFVRRDLMEAIAIGFDYAAIAGTGLNDQPTGILNTVGIGSVVGGTNGAAPTWAHIVALAASVANANAAGGSAGFLFSTKVESKLRITPKITGTDSKMILDDGQLTLAGKRWLASNNVPDGLTKGTAAAVCSAIIFGNWADVILASFGSGVDVIVDPYTLATSGQTRVVVNSLCDVAIRRPASFAAMKDALTA